MERQTQVDTSITSHLLAALNLPPLRDVAPYPAPAEQQPRDRPLPLEPSASQEVYHSQQYQSGRREPSGGAIHQPQSPTHANGPAEAISSDAVHPALKDHSIDEMLQQVGPGPTNGVGTRDDITEQSQGDAMGSSSRPFPSILPTASPAASPHTPKNKAASRGQNSSVKSSSNRRVRRKWTEEETNDLIKGCHIHGVGNWKKVLDDPRFKFNGRSSVDLKDRFRTCFPKEYRKGTIEAEESAEPATPVGESGEGNGSPLKENGKSKRKVTKTELHHAEVLEKLGIDSHFPKVQRRERREFTADEDSRLLQGFTIYGASWSRIQNDPALQLGHRRSTDLRDRFRNAFPERYESAGFKARPRQRPKLARSPEVPAEDQKQPNESDEVDERTEPTMETSRKGDSTALLMHSLLGGNMSPTWGGQDVSAVTTDQSPAPGSLALDPALNEGFEGSSLEQITEDFLAVAQGGGKEGQQGSDHQGQHDLMRWEEMATHPIFELEPSMTSSGGGGHAGDGSKKSAIGGTKKRIADAENLERVSELKRLRTPAQA